MEKILNYILTAEGVYPSEPVLAGVQGEHRATALVFAPDSALSEAIAKAGAEGYEIFCRINSVTEAGECGPYEEREVSKISEPFYLTSALTTSGLDAFVTVQIILKDTSGAVVKELHKAVIKLFFENAPTVSLVSVKKTNPTKALEETAEAIFQEIERIGEEAEQKITLKLEEVKAQAKTSAEQLKKVVSFAQETRVAAELAKENRNAAELSADRCEATAETIGALVHDAANLANKASASAVSAENSETQAADCAAISIESAELAEQKAKEAAEAKEKSAQNAVSAKQSRDEAEEILNNTRQQAESVKGEHEKFAGALRGQASGKVITLSDVSSVSHNLDVELSSDSITDFSGVKVTIGGVNLFDISKVKNSQYLTNNGDGTLTVSGAYGVYTNITLAEFCPSLKVGDKVSLKMKTEGNPTLYLNISKFTWQTGSSLSHIITEDDLNSIVNVYGKPDKGTYTIGNIMVHYYTGSVLPFEPYVGHTEYTANADGIVEGAKSVYPTTMIYTNTEGTTIDCEYNRDINKAFEELTNALISLGGEV